MKKFLNNKILNKKIQIKHRFERSGPVQVSNFFGPKKLRLKNFGPSHLLEKQDRTGLDRTGLGWAGLDRCHSYSSPLSKKKTTKMKIL
jgi:hypothetical protein